MLRSLTDKQKAATFYGITFALAVTVAFLGPGSPDLIQVLYMLTPTIGVLLLLVLTPDGHHRSSWALLAMHRAGWRGWLPGSWFPWRSSPPSTAPPSWSESGRWTSTPT
jgi:hypothetical protein